MQKLRIALKVISVGVLVSLAGCSIWNPFASEPSKRNLPAPLVEFTPTAKVHTSWSTSVGKAGQYVFTPALAGGSLYVAAADGKITRLNAKTGQTQWQIDAGMGLTAGVGSDGDLVVVGGENGTVLAYDTDGKFRWKAKATSQILSAPAVGQGVVIVRSLDNYVAAFDAATGKRRWLLQRSAPSLSLRTAPGIVIANSSAYVGLAGGRLLSLTLNNGAPRWEIAVGDPRGTTELERIADVSGTPVVAGSDVCAVAYQGRIGCVDAATGSGQWARTFSSNVGVAVDAKNIYAADENGALYAFARNSGASVWRNNQLAHRDLSTPAVSYNAVAVGDYQGYIHFFSKEDGLMKARIATDGSPILAAPLMAEGNFVFQTQAGTVTAVAVE